jgi:hypothetical protein
MHDAPIPIYKDGIEALAIVVAALGLWLAVMAVAVWVLTSTSLA